MKRLFILAVAVIMLSSCSSGKTVASVGRTKITEGEFDFYLSSIKQQMQDTELQTDEDWETKEIEGKKAIELAKQRAMEEAVKNAEYYEVGKSVIPKLSANEKQSIELTKQRVVSSYGGEKAYKAFLKENNITDKFIDMMCSSTLYYTKLLGVLKENNPVTDEQKQSYYEKNKTELETEYRKAKHILILTADPTTMQPKSDEEVAEAKDKAKKIYDRAKKGEDFDSLMNTYSEDTGLSTNPDGYVFTSGQMMEEFEQATDSIAPGQLTYTETAYGCHIIKRLPVEYDDISEFIENRILEENLAKKIPEWEKEYKIRVEKNEEI